MPPPGVPLQLQHQQPAVAYAHPMAGYQPHPLQPYNGGASSSGSAAGAKGHYRTPIHAPGEPEGKLPYLLPDKLGVALGFPSQAPTIPTLGECTAEGDLVTIRATGVSRWRLELKDEAWNEPINAVCESKTATFRLQGAGERSLTVRVCKASEDGTCGAFTGWAPVTAPPPPAEAVEDTAPAPVTAADAPPAPPPPAFVGAGFSSSADEEAAAAHAAAVAVQAAARGHRTRLEAKAVRSGLRREEAAEFAAGAAPGEPAAATLSMPASAPPGLTSWAAGLGVHKLLAAALLPMDAADGRAPVDDVARLRAVAALGTAEIAGRLASAGLSGLVDYVVAAVEALPPLGDPETAAVVPAGDAPPREEML